MTENRIFTLCHMITWVVFFRMFLNFISSLPVKRGGSLSFLGGTISNVLVMEIGWTDVESGGYILVSCAHSNTSVKIDVTDKLANAQNRLLIASKVIIALINPFSQNKSTIVHISLFSARVPLIQILTRMIYKCQYSLNITYTIILCCYMPSNLGTYFGEGECIMPSNLGTCFGI
jgi:hypothetical protein